MSKTQKLQFVHTPHPSPLPADKRAELLKNPGFGRVFTDHMVTIRYHESKGWHDARVEPRAPIPMDPAAAVLHYAQEVFEGLKAYRTADGGATLFRPIENARRFQKSAERLAMPSLPEELFIESVDKLRSIDRAWIPEGDGSLYLRPFMFANEVFLGVKPSSDYLYLVIASSVGAYFNGDSPAVSVWVSDDYTRAAPGGTGAAKCGGNYAASLIVGEEVARLGYQQVLWLDGIERKYVEEVGAMNIAFAYGKHIVTPQLSGTILRGITRKSVLELAPTLGYTVSEERISIDQVLKDLASGAITESFGMGTAAVIAPVGRFGYKGRDYLVNNNEVGPVAHHLYKTLTDIQYGRAPDPFGWTLRIATGR